MTAATTVLNVGTGGDRVLHDTLTTVDGAAAPASAVSQVVKVAWGAQNTATLVSTTNPLPVTGTAPLTGSGSLTAAAQTVTLTTGGRYANTVFQVSGTWVGTLVFEASNDNFTSTTTINALRAGDNTISQTITDTASNDIYRCTTAGFGAVRLRMLAFTSGTAVVTALACEAASGVFLNFPLPPGQNNIGTVALAPATLHVTATGAVNTAVTATLPAAGVGLFHYITSIQLVKLYAVVGVASGAGVVVTSTNLPGSPAWLTEQVAGPAGSAPRVIDYQPTTPLKCSAANVATTLVAPLQLQTIWRWNISYFTAA